MMHTETGSLSIKRKEPEHPSMPSSDQSQAEKKHITSPSCSDKNSNQSADLSPTSQNNKCAIPSLQSECGTYKPSFHPRAFASPCSFGTEPPQTAEMPIEPFLQAIPKEKPTDQIDRLFFNKIAQHKISSDKAARVLKFLREYTIQWPANVPAGVYPSMKYFNRMTMDTKKMLLLLNRDNPIYISKKTVTTVISILWTVEGKGDKVEFLRGGDLAKPARYTYYGLQFTPEAAQEVQELEQMKPTPKATVFGPCTNTLAPNISTDPNTSTNGLLTKAPDCPGSVGRPRRHVGMKGRNPSNNNHNMVYVYETHSAVDPNELFYLIRIILPYPTEAEYNEWLNRLEIDLVNKRMRFCSTYIPNTVLSPQTAQALNVNPNMQPVISSCPVTPVRFDISHALPNDVDPVAQYDIFPGEGGLCVLLRRLKQQEQDLQRNIMPWSASVPISAHAPTSCDGISTAAASMSSATSDTVLVGSPEPHVPH